MKNNKELVALSVGFLLIASVAVFTLYRNSTKKTDGLMTQKLSDNAPSYTVITPREFQEKIKNSEAVDIIDIRSLEEYATEHILDSISVPIDSLGSYQQQSGRTPVIFMGIPQPEQINFALDEFKKKNIYDVAVLDADLELWKDYSGSTVSYGDPTKFSDQSKVSYISKDDLKTKLDKNENVFVIDVRSAEKFVQGHLPRAINIPLEEIEKRRGEISLSKQSILYSDIELEAFQAAVRLYESRFVVSSVLKGGYSEWLSGNLPTEK